MHPWKMVEKMTTSNTANSLCLSHDRDVITSPVLTYVYLKDFVITVPTDHIAYVVGWGRSANLNAEVFFNTSTETD